MRRGLVLGKFYPMHMGHICLIRQARERCDDLTVLVGASITESIPLQERIEWVKKLFPDVRVVGCYDEIPDDYGSDQVWKEHISLFAEHTGAVDVIFTSEGYGPELALRYGAEHEWNDAERLSFPISASMIRDDTLTHWDDIAWPAKAYLAKRIVIIGAESTGTTTLAHDLVQHLDAQFVCEYGRKYVEEERNEVPWEDDDFLRIIARQNRLESLAATMGAPYVICDTNTFATKVWQERYMGYVSDDVRCIAEQSRADLYILTSEEGVRFDQDGTRDGGPMVRKWMNQEFREQLDHYGKPWIEVTGSPESRVEQALTYIEEVKWRYSPPLTREGSWRPPSVSV